MGVTTQQEIAAGERFAFGENWQRFLSILNDGRVAKAEESLRRMLAVPDLHDKSFLDIGCGSGLFSLAARRLGARVHSFDYDPQSVACARELRRRYFTADPCWTIEEASVLDLAHLATLGQFDVVYSWGVLHHTGAMWQALENAAGLVAPNGLLFIAIYNDQGKISNRWRAIKHTYNRLPPSLRFLVSVPVLVYLHWRPTLKDFFRLKPFTTWRAEGKERGMSAWRDLVDWVGGYPFEVAKPEAIFDFYLRRGFSLRRLSTCGGTLGCNEFVFARDTSPHATTPRVTEPRPSGSGHPRATEPRPSGSGHPRATEPRPSGSGHPRATEPRPSGSGHPRATDPRPSGSGHPRATEPRPSGSGHPRATDPRPSGSGHPRATEPRPLGSGH
jgi:SAM-dependent methyltransferase